MPALVAVALDQRTAAVVVLGPIRGGLRSVLEHRRCDVGELPAYLRRLADLHGSPRAGAWGCATTTEGAAVRAVLLEQGYRRISRPKKRGTGTTHVWARAEAA